MNLFQGDKCPKCGENQLPKIPQDSKAEARACANCGYIERLTNEGKIKDWMKKK